MSKNKGWDISRALNQNYEDYQTRQKETRQQEINRKVRSVPGTTLADAYVEMQDEVERRARIISSYGDKYPQFDPENPFKRLSVLDWEDLKKNMSPNEAKEFLKKHNTEIVYPPKPSKKTESSKLQVARHMERERVHRKHQARIELLKKFPDERVKTDDFLYDSDGNFKKKYLRDIPTPPRIIKWINEAKDPKAKKAILDQAGISEEISSDPDPVKRQEARLEQNKKQQPVTKESKLLDILKRGADYGKKALGPLSIAAVGYEALTAKDAQAALSDFINDAMFINPITAGVATALTSSEAGRGSELSDKDYDRMMAESFEYEKDPDRYVGPIEEDTYIEEKPRPTGRLPKSGSPTFMSVE